MRIMYMLGLPSQTFYHIMRHLNGINDHNEVVITITPTEVRFASGNVMNTLRTEDLGCSIGGMEGSSRIAGLKICKFSINALLEASRLCDTVWLYKSVTNDSPDLVYCAVGSIGNIKFYHIQHGFPIPGASSYPKHRRKRRKL
ncbi:uncharacterized protein LOC130783094 [Actinidia eriantha]|uniref:uncharacterized protein LOC130783094 n=1 Tax=Actinidia eriantha TaxID=165200 RepID=UPI00258DCB89|nr:uncharacterized protein LOC130783094 [Actinidia eriantha]